jgi:hypothetical protein
MRDLKRRLEALEACVEGPGQYEPRAVIILRRRCSERSGTEDHDGDEAHIAAILDALQAEARARQVREWAVVLGISVPGGPIAVSGVPWRQAAELR